MSRYEEEQLADHEMNKAYNDYFESLTEEEKREEMVQRSIPEAKDAADYYMDYILGKIVHPIHSHPHNLERWYRRRDLRFKPFLWGHIEGTLKEQCYFKEETDKYPTEYTEEEIKLFAEQYAGEKIPDNNNKKNLVWIAYYKGYMWGYYKTNPNQRQLLSFSLYEAPF